MLKLVNYPKIYIHEYTKGKSMCKQSILGMPICCNSENSDWSQLCQGKSNIINIAITVTKCVS